MASRRDPSEQGLVEIRPAIAPPGKAPLRGHDLIEIELLHEELRIVDARNAHYGCANGADDHALTDVTPPVFVAGAIDRDDKHAALVGAAAQRQFPRIS